MKSWAEYIAEVCEKSGLPCDSEDFGALHGFKVVDFGQYAAGPLVAAILADFGATVVRVNPPGGPMWKHHANVRMNYKKCCDAIEIDLKINAKDLLELLAEADVIVENFRPGVMKSFGLGPEDISAINPSIVYVSLPGFASGDERLSKLRANEGIILARSGLFSDMGLNRTLMGVDPSYTPLMQASTYASALGAMAVSACLYRREITGRGDHIEVPLASALLDALVYNSIEIDSLPPRYKPMRTLEIERRRALNLPMNLKYSDIDRMLDPFYATYFCKDGRPFYLVAVAHFNHHQRTLKLLGLWDRLVAQGLPVDRDLVMKDWNESVRCVLGTYPITDVKWIRILKREITEAFKTRTAEEWTHLFGAFKVPGHATLTTKEWMRSQHARSSELVVEVETDVYVPGPFAWLQRAKVPVEKRTRKPTKGDNKSSKEEETFKTACHDGGVDDGNLWLRGVNVLDLCNVIAGPMIGGSLARFGADVVKCDMKNPIYGANITTLLGLPANRGKRSILVEIGSSEGRKVLEDLIRWADVVTVNQTWAQLTALRLDEVNLKRVNPSVILMHFDAFSGPQWGSWSDHLGYDDVLQAVLGIMERFGGSLEHPEEHAHIGTIDVLGGFCGAIASIMALIKRRRTGRVEVARASLASAGNLLQINVSYDAPKYIERAARGTDLGAHALCHWYEDVDGTPFFINCKIEDAEKAFAAIVTSTTFAPHVSILEKKEEDDDDRSRTRTLGAIFKCVKALDAIAALRKTGLVEAVLKESLANLRKTFSAATTETTDGKGRIERVRNNTYVFDRESDHPIGHSVTMFATDASIRPRHGKLLALAPAPKYGANTREILRDVLHKDDDAIEKLVQGGVVGEKWSDQYLPTGDPWRLCKDELVRWSEGAASKGVE
eukprot:g2152.t1